MDNKIYFNKIARILQEMKGKPLDPVGAEDKDIDNDGDHDKSDKYLHKRRKAITKSMSMKKESKCSCEDEDYDDEDYDDDEEESSMKKKKSSKSMKKESLDEVEQRPGVPFSGPYRDVSKPRKDHYGNIIKDKNAAKNLAKQGMAGVKKEEAEQIDELSVKKLTSYLYAAQADRQKHAQAAGKARRAPERLAARAAMTKRAWGMDDAALKIRQKTGTQRPMGIERVFAGKMKEEAEQMAEAFVIHKGKHAPGRQSSLVGTHHGVTVEPVYTDKKKAQAHADKINAGRGYKPGDHKNPLYGGVLYQVSPAKQMKEGVEGKRLAGIDATIRKLAKESVVVQSDQWGVGESIPGKFRVAESDNGLKYVTHCDVMFAHGIEFDVPANELVIHEADNRAMHYKNGTKPEGMMDKESAGSKKFAAAHDYGKAELIYDDEAGHEDAAKAGRVVKQTKPNRGDQRIGHLKPKD